MVPLSLAYQITYESTLFSLIYENLENEAFWLVLQMPNLHTF